MKYESVVLTIVDISSKIGGVTTSILITFTILSYPIQLFLKESFMIAKIFIQRKDSHYLAKTFNLGGAVI